MLTEDELDDAIASRDECFLSLSELVMETSGGAVVTAAIDGKYYDEDFDIPGDGTSPYFLHADIGGDDMEPYIALYAEDFPGECRTVCDTEFLPCLVEKDKSRRGEGNVRILMPCEGSFACKREVARKCLMVRNST